jgi:hypothetical protein
VQKAALLLCLLLFLCGLTPKTGIVLSNGQLPDGVWTVRNGKFYKRGVRKFLTAIYYIDYYADSGAAQTERIAAIQAAAAAGMDVVHVALSLSSDATVAAAKAANIDLMAEGNGATLTQLVQRYPEIPFLSVYDDLNHKTLGAYDHPPQTVTDAVKDLHKLGTFRHIIYASGGLTGLRDFFSTGLDVIAEQCYPLVGYEAIGVCQSSYWPTGASYTKGAFVANVQAFNQNASGWPTAAEVQNMSDQAVAVGAAGIMYYAYKDPGGSLADHADIWAGISSWIALGH